MKFYLIFAIAVGIACFGKSSAQNEVNLDSIHNMFCNIDRKKIADPATFEKFKKDVNIDAEGHNGKIYRAWDLLDWFNTDFQLPNHPEMSRDQWRILTNSLDINDINQALSTVELNKNTTLIEIFAKLLLNPNVMKGFKLDLHI